jgi:hypothetical protein
VIRVPEQTALAVVAVGHVTTTTAGNSAVAVPVEDVGITLGGVYGEISRLRHGDVCAPPSDGSARARSSNIA